MKKVTVEKKKPNWFVVGISIVITGFIMYNCTGMGDTKQIKMPPKVETVKSTKLMDEIKAEIAANEAKFKNRVATIRATTQTLSFSGGQSYTLPNETTIFLSTKGYQLNWGNGTRPATGVWLGGLSYSFEGETLTSATGAGQKNMTDLPISNGLLRYSAKDKTLTITETNLSGSQKITKYNNCKITFTSTKK
jgi:nitrogen regulatory protein PII